MKIKFVQKLRDLFFVVAFMGSFSVLAQGVLITSFDHTGELVFADSNGATWFYVEGCDVLGGPWTNTWDYLNNIASAESGIVTCTVPVTVTEPRMFFRVISMFEDAPDGMEFVLGGAFDMGDSFGESTADELPVHSVNITRYFVDQTEVTWTKWQEVYDWALSHGYQFDNIGSGKGASHPVQNVSWYDTVKWCNARCEMDGLEPCYYTDRSFTSVYRRNTYDPYCDWTAGGYRLPTEAEWEKASRGGLVGNRFSLGDTISHSNANYYVQHIEGVIVYSYDEGPEVGYHPDYDVGGFSYTSPVGSFMANGYGLFDMEANVFEWCWDKYNEDYYAISAVDDPTGSIGGFYRVYRGGCWDDDAEVARNSKRGYMWAGGTEIRVGFRCVISTKD